MKVFSFFQEMIKLYSCKLSEEKSKDQHRIGDQGKTDTTEYAFGNNEWYRDMD